MQRLFQWTHSGHPSERLHFCGKVVEAVVSMLQRRCEETLPAFATISNAEQDPVHLPINYPPKLTVSSLVNGLKGVSSRLLRRDRPDMAVLWTPGYFTSSGGGTPISIIRQYIEQQQTSG